MFRQLNKDQYCNYKIPVYWNWFWPWCPLH